MDISSVDSNGEITGTEELLFEDAPSRARRLPKAGDTILSTVRTYLKAIAFIEGDATDLVCSTGFAVVRPGKFLDPRFLFYWLRSSWIVDEICARSLGVSYPAINPSEVGNLPVPVLPLPRQRSIASFLDRKTAAIDALIEKKQRLIELLEEKRQAVISRAVTKGLDPNVKMKDSGVPWLGEIPAHWEVCRLKHLVSEKVAGPYGSSLTKSMYSESGYRVYGQQQVIPGDFKVGDYYISEEKFQEMGRYQVYPGDLLVSVMGTVGCVAVVPDDVERGIINPRLVRYRPNGGKVHSEFLALAMESSIGAAQMKLMAHGTTMDGLSMGVLDELLIPVPPVPEQKAIFAATKEAGGELHDAALAIEHQIDRLREYRQALITAAVTGKIDVRGEEAA